MTGWDIAVGGDAIGMSGGLETLGNRWKWHREWNRG